MENLDNVATIPQAETQAIETVLPTEPIAEIPRTLKLKYNHEVREVDELEAVELAQKGLNYDKQHEQLENYKQVDTLFEKAKTRGMTAKQYLDYLENTTSNNEILTFAEENGITDFEMAKKQYDDHITANEARATKETQRAETQKQEIGQQSYIELVTKYPDIKKEDLTPEIMADFEKGGVSLVSAYEKHKTNGENVSLKAQLAELQAKLSANKTNADNEDTALPSLQGGGSSITAELTAEDVNKMSTKELSQNWGAVKKLFKMK